MFEARVVVWKTKDIENMDWEGMSDIYCRAFFDADEDQKTDTHWRCHNGEGSFNYRLKFKIKSKEPVYRLTIQAWDKDIVASDDIIGECDLNVTPMFKDSHVTGKQMIMSKQYFDTYLKEAMI